MQGVSITKSDEYNDFDDRGKPRVRIRVQFKVDEDGPFTQYFEKDGFDSQSVRHQLENFAREIRALRT